MEIIFTFRKSWDRNTTYLGRDYVKLQQIIFGASGTFPGIERNKTMADKIMYTSNDDTQFTPSGQWALNSMNQQIKIF